MPSEVRWYLPERVIEIHLFGRISAEDLKELAQSAMSLMKTTTQPLYVISDELDIEQTPINLSAIKEALLFLSDKQIKYVVSVSKPDRLANFIASVVTQFYGINHKRFTSREEALAFLQQEDNTLNFEG